MVRVMKEFDWLKGVNLVEPARMTKLDLAICRALQDRWARHGRAALANVNILNDQRFDGQHWSPVYPMGKIAACVMAEEHGLWEPEKGEHAVSKIRRAQIAWRWQRAHNR